MYSCGVGRTLSVFGTLGASKCRTLRYPDEPDMDAEILISTPDRLKVSEVSTLSAPDPAGFGLRSELGVRWLVERGFTKTRLANQRERGWRSRAFQLSRGLQAVGELLFWEFLLIMLTFVALCRIAVYLCLGAGVQYIQAFISFTTAHPLSPLP